MKQCMIAVFRHDANLYFVPWICIDALKTRAKSHINIDQGHILQLYESLYFPVAYRRVDVMCQNVKMYKLIHFLALIGLGFALNPPRVNQWAGMPPLCQIDPSPFLAIGLYVVEML